jgi:type IX secretion system substrate protein
MYKIILIIAFAIGTITCKSATITATGTGGEWISGTSWIGGAIPSNGDIVVIPFGSTITITNQTVNFNGTVNISGTLSLIATGGFATGGIGVLDMDATSVVNILAGGQIASGGGGFWEFLNGIEIGTNVIAYWPVFDGDIVSGPSTITEAGGVLPIKLLFFKAKVANRNVVLEWATSTEENFDYFSLERSIDGKEFIEIAQIQGVGDSYQRVDYNYLDEFPLQGRSYYRLRSVDFDGYTEIFDYVMVEVEGISVDFNIYPNPISSGKFSIKTNFESENDVELLVYNSLGSIERKYQINSWVNNLGLEGLKPGNYLFELISNEGVIIKRVLVN